jgi:hypothetical protein
MLVFNIKKAYAKEALAILSVNWVGCSLDRGTVGNIVWASLCDANPFSKGRRTAVGGIK